MPEIWVTPLRTVNFTNVTIQFIINVTNIPQCYIQMFEAVAVTPSGSQRFQCPIRSGTSKDQFQGCFTATAEVGHYTVKVTLKLRDHPRTASRFMNSGNPSKFDVGQVSDTVNILVCRNYLKESLKLPSRTFVLDYQQGNNTYQREFGCGDAWGLTCDKQTDRIYYTGGSGNCISCVDTAFPGGKLIFSVSRSGGAEVDERVKGIPVGICCDEYHRRLIVCEKNSHRVSFFSLDTAEYITSFGAFGYQNGFFNCPWDVDVSPRGNHIVVTDSENKRIQLFDRDGNYLRQLYLGNPRGICFDANQGHKIYVTDWNSGELIEVPLGLQSSRNIIAKDFKFRRPQGIASDSSGTLLVADSKIKCVTHWAASTDEINQPLSTISRVGRTSLKCPVNLTIMRDGSVAVLEVSGKVHII